MDHGAWNRDGGHGLQGGDRHVDLRPGVLEKCIDLSVMANNTRGGDRSLSVVVPSVTGATVHLANANGVVTIIDED